MNPENSLFAGFVLCHTCLTLVFSSVLTFPVFGSFAVAMYLAHGSPPPVPLPDPPPVPPPDPLPAPEPPPEPFPVPGPDPTLPALLYFSMSLFFL